MIISTIEEDARSNQFVIRVYDLMKNTKSALVVENQLEIDEPVITKKRSADGKSIENEPIYEYKLDNQIKYFQADTSYVKLQ